MENNEPVKVSEFETKIVSYDSAIDNSYAIAMQSAGKDSQILSLEQIPAELKDRRIRQLNAKLNKFSNAILILCTGYDAKSLKDLSFKVKFRRDALRILLAQKSLNFDALLAVYKTQEMPINGEDYSALCDRIRGYVDTGDNLDLTIA